MKSLPSHLPFIVSYVGTQTHRPSIPIHPPSLFSMANISGSVDNTGVHTPSSLLGGGSIPISTISPSSVHVSSTSILIPSGGT